MKFFYVYKITNLINNKIYIGKTCNVKKRWKDHKFTAKNKNKKDYTYLHRAINKYGENFFKIEIVGKFQSEKNSLKAERSYINHYKSNQRIFGYNLTEGGEGSSGYKHTEEALKLMSKIKKATFMGNGNPFYGKTHSDKTRQILSKNAQNRIGSKNPFYNKKHSEKTKNLLRLNHKNKEKYLSKQDLEDIKYKRQVLKRTYLEIAKEYNMHWKSISNAVNSKRAYS